MSILLHTCCAPCLIGPYQALIGQGNQATAFFFNPNIMPYREFRKRLQSFKEFTTKRAIPFIINENYSLEAILRRFLDRGEAPRCRICYDIRLEETARMAAEKGFEAFASTLCVSPYQDHTLIRAAGEAAAEKFGVQFLYQDWRPHFKEGHDEAISLGLYRQGYCGCIFREEERYRPSVRKKLRHKDI